MKNSKCFILTLLFLFSFIGGFSQSKWTSFPNKGAVNYSSGSLGMFNYVDSSTWLVNRDEVYVYKGSSWSAINRKTAGIQSDILAFFVDSKHNIWVWSKGSVIPVIQDDRKGAIKKTDTSKLGSNGMLTKYDGKNWTSWTNKELGINSNYVSKVFEGSNGDIWVALADPDSSIPVFGPDLGGIALEVGANAIIKAARNGGLLQFTNGKWITHQDDLPGKKYRFLIGIYETSDKKLWFLTQTGNFLTFENGKFTEIKNIGDFDFGKSPFGLQGYYYKIFQNSKLDLFITNIGGIAIYNGQNWQTFDKKTGLSKFGLNFGIFKTKDSSLVSVAVTGIYKFNGTDKWSEDFAYGRRTRLPFGTISDQDKKIWVLQNGDLGVYDGTVFKWVLQDKDINRFFVDRELRTWALTKKAMYLGINDSWTTFDNINKVKRLFEDYDGIVWLLTENGLASYSKGNFETYDEKSGLSSSQVKQIFLTSDHNIWIITDKGLCEFNRK